MRVANVGRQLSLLGRWFPRNLATKIGSKLDADDVVSGRIEILCGGVARASQRPNSRTCACEQTPPPEGCPATSSPLLTLEGALVFAKGGAQGARNGGVAEGNSCAPRGAAPGNRECGGTKQRAASGWRSRR